MYYLCIIPQFQNPFPVRRANPAAKPYKGVFAAAKKFHKKI